MKPGYCYLMRDSIGRHKIGFSKSPKSRLSLLRCETGDGSITLVHVIQTDDMVQLERVLHKMHDACRDEGEWFNLDEKAIADLCARESWPSSEMPDIPEEPRCRIIFDAPDEYRQAINHALAMRLMENPTLSPRVNSISTLMQEIMEKHLAEHLAVVRELRKNSQ